jgi:RNA polymerase sigma-70 factor (ECF subfamily)
MSKRDPTQDPASAASNVEPLEPAATARTDAEARVFLAALFTKYRGALFRYLAHLVPTTEDAAELVQESYARLLRQNTVSRLEAVARTYLFHTATNLARDHFRRRLSRRASLHLDIDEQPVIDDSADPQRALAWQQTVGAIKAGIRELPPLTRRVFLLSRFRNKTYPEIAAMLGVSTRTVERKMSEAMDVLAKRMGEGP